MLPMKRGLSNTPTNYVLVTNCLPESSVTKIPTKHAVLNKVVRLKPVTPSGAYAKQYAVSINATLVLRLESVGRPSEAELWRQS